MVVDDLLAMPDQGRIVAEGAGLFPERVTPLLSDPRAAIWLIATRRVGGAKAFGFPADGLLVQLQLSKTDHEAVARQVAD